MIEAGSAGTTAIEMPGTAKRCLLVACGLLSTACWDPNTAEDTDTDIDTSTGADVEASEATTASTSTSGTSSTGESSSNPSTSTTTTDADASTTDPASPDVGGVQACDTFEDDCPEGTKCTAYASTGAGDLDALGCLPLARDPIDLDGACEITGNGLDDCDAGALRWGGVCRAFCSGDAMEPVCDDARMACARTENEVVAVCLVACDPLLQDCAEAEACLPMSDAFVCALDNSGSAGRDGDPCEAFDECDPGLFCTPAESLGGCGGASGCCTSFCDGADPERCADAVEGTECVRVFDADTHDVGACVLP